MIVDSSALMVVLNRELEADRILRALSDAPSRRLSAGNALECGIVVTRKELVGGVKALERLLVMVGIEIVPTDHAQVRLAWEAFERFGKGRHPAGLNFGDCFAYALSRSTGLPLLFKGDDFGRTDVLVAPW